MTQWLLKFILKSDATFGSGEGVAGMIDTEVQHDDCGLPFLAGRTLKGLLSAACADIMFALNEQGKLEHFRGAVTRLFGVPGNFDGKNSIVHFGDAKLPLDFRNAVATELNKKTMTREQVLEGLTAIRHQTAVDEITGAPKTGSLRGMRVILRETPFEADLSFDQDPRPVDLMLIAACVKAFRLAGMGRNRGRGELVAQLIDDKGQDATNQYYEQFKMEVLR